MATDEETQAMLRRLYDDYSAATSRYADAVVVEKRLIGELRKAQRDISAAADTCDRLYIKWAEFKERTHGKG